MLIHWFMPSALSGRDSCLQLNCKTCTPSHDPEEQNSYGGKISIARQSHWHPETDGWAPQARRPWHMGVSLHCGRHRGAHLDVSQKSKAPHPQPSRKESSAEHSWWHFCLMQKYRKSVAQNLKVIRMKPAYSDLGRSRNNSTLEILPCEAAYTNCSSLGREDRVIIRSRF